MRWLVAALAALLIAAPAQAAKVLLVEPKHPTDIDGAPSIMRLNRMVKDIFETYGVEYKSVRWDVLKTEDARTGVMVWSRGTGAAYAETFDAVVHLWRANTNVVVGALRADSMLTVARPPLVPQLFVLNDITRVGGAGYSYANTACCTTGVWEGGGGVSGPGQVANANAMLYVSEHDQRRRWFTDGSFTVGFRADDTFNSTAGGVRKHISMASGATPFVVEQTFHNCLHCDSLRFAVTDSMAMWERMFNVGGGAQPAIFVSVDGNGGFSDSAKDADGSGQPPAEVSKIMILAGLARLDSLVYANTGERLITKPRTYAVTFDGAFTHHVNRRYGMPPADSSVFKASLDSLATLGIPVTFGVNIDSVAAYPNEKAWYERVPLARYTPQSWMGVSDTSAAATGPYTSPRISLDVLGRYRARAAYGDGSAVGADTSLWARLKWALFKADSIFGRGRVERFLLAPDDDWSPKNIRPIGGGPDVDSVLWAIHRAGFKGIRVWGWDNAGSGTARTTFSANPLGWINNQEVVREGVGGNQLTLIRHNGFPIVGGTKAYHTGNDTASAPADSGSYLVQYAEHNRMWTGFTQDEDWVDYDTWPRDFTYFFATKFTAGLWLDVDIPRRDIASLPRRAYIRTFHIRDLGGVPNGPPARNAYWVLKSAVNAAETINKLAGRTVVRFGYPTEVDVRR